MTDAGSLSSIFYNRFNGNKILGQQYVLICGKPTSEKLFLFAILENDSIIDINGRYEQCAQHRTASYDCAHTLEVSPTGL